ncbi:hypothetical protein [Serratia oryzae]|uniref:Uncharacterized protein n=1 Tax=Serratia oryzae TaxID=2034155 RepID=A0A1S8CK20_9GAMM|nr:hypothetical protein [Serratia oryzae]OMQ23706.1 hypothetical protein BMI79_09345 [Serratia oryzae]
MTVFITVFSGVLVYVIGQIIMKLIIEPVNDLKRAISKIVYDLIFYSNKLANPMPPGNEEMVEACKVMRQHSSTLHSATHLIPGYKHIYRIFGLPSPEGIKEATQKLIYLSNGYSGVLDNQAIRNLYAIQEVRLSLRVPIPEGEMLDPENKKAFMGIKPN